MIWGVKVVFWVSIVIPCFPFCCGPVLVGLLLKPFILSGEIISILNTGSVQADYPDWINGCLSSTSQITDVDFGSDFTPLSARLSKWRAWVGVFLVTVSIVILSGYTVCCLSHFADFDWRHAGERHVMDDEFKAQKNG